MEKTKKNILYKYIIFFILTFLLVFLCLKSSIIREVLYLLLISFAIAYTLRPIQKEIQQGGLSKGTAALIVICALILLVLAAFIILIPSMLRESLSLNNTLDSIQKLIDRFYLKLKPMSNNKTIYIIMDNIYGKLNSHLVGMFSKILDTALSIGQNIVTIAVMPIISYYFLSDGDYIGNRLLNFLPVKSRNMVKKISCDVDKILGRYIVSQLLLCVIIGIATFVILITQKVNFPVILSILNAFFNIVPYFGPIFGAVPAIFVALIDSPEKALWTAIWLYGLQQIEGNILSPKITGDSISMHPLIVILLLIIGGEASGVLGMILAVPIGVIVKVVYEDLNYYLF